MTPVKKADYVDVIIRDDEGRFLLQHHPHSKMKPWRFPGGKPELGETLIETAAREAMEELGIEPLSLKFLGYGNSTVESGDWTGAMFLCDNYHGIPTIMENAKHDQLRFMTLEELEETGAQPEYSFAKTLCSS